VFIGHFALGFAAKRIAPRTSLGTLLAAPELADILFPLFVMLGWEKVAFTSASSPFLSITLDQYPISHSLVALIAWGIVFALLYRWRTGYGRGAAVVALLVVSHWVLDYVTHRPDMPLWPGGPKVGLELWASVPGTLIVEGLLFGAGVAIYARATRARDAVGRYAFGGLVLLLLGLYVASLFSPPPPPGNEFAVVGLILTVVFVGLGAWVDRHREASSGSGTA
jgi:membrane-bound metal-dependent hydrolase YbcI (DUF457 family)